MSSSNMKMATHTSARVHHLWPVSWAPCAPVCCSAVRLTVPPTRSPDRPRLDSPPTVTAGVLFPPTVHPGGAGGIAARRGSGPGAGGGVGGGHAGTGGDRDAALELGHRVPPHSARVPAGARVGGGRVAAEPGRQGAAVARRRRGAGWPAGAEGAFPGQEGGQG